MLDTHKKEFITFMLDAGVLRFGDFITKSGRNTPYFVNTGNYKTGAQIATLGKYYAALVQQTCNQDFDALFGPAYKGIPLVTVTAASLMAQYRIDKPYFFNRKEIKDHGEGGNVIGYPPSDGDEIIIIEDVITAGTAIREVLPILQACADVTVKHMFISVDRCEVGNDGRTTAIQQMQQEFGIAVHAIVTVRDIREYLVQNDFPQAQIQAMDAYMQRYCI